LHNIPIQENISVIIPTYNFANVTRKTLNAVISQSLAPKEVIIIDSTESNEIRHLVNEIESKIKIFYRKSDKILFPGEARNEGVRLSNFEWLAFLDSKTVPDNNWLKNNFNLIIEKKADVVFGSTTYSAETNFQECLRACNFGIKSIETTPGSVIKKHNFNKTGGFQEKVRAGEDLAWRQVIKKSSLVSYTSKKASLTYFGLPTGLMESIKRFFIYQLYGSLVDIQNTSKNIYFGIFLILITLIVPKWNLIVGFNSKFFIPNITTIYVTIFFVISFLILIFNKSFFKNKNSFISFSVKVAIFILLFYSAIRWNYAVADFVEDSIFFIPHITKIYLSTVIAMSFIYRGLYFPLINEIKLNQLLPFWWIKVGLVGLILDLAKAPGYVLGAIIKFINR
jgi:glycosyltransferase involved in cell wall biosynthesis